MKAFVLLCGVLAASLAEADETERLLAELTNAHGVSGFEGPVRDILRREWKDLLTDLHTDGLGNLIGSLRGSSDTPRVLLMAHMDEVGFLVRQSTRTAISTFTTPAATSIRASSRSGFRS